MVTKTHTLKLARIIVAALTTVVALVSTMAFLTAIRTQAAPLLGTGNDPEIRLITMTADLPHYDPTASDGITKTIYFSNSVSGVITMTFDISGTQTLTLTAGAAFSETERVYTSSSQTWVQPITYTVKSTHTSQYNIAYTATRDNGFTTTVAITYMQDITAPASFIAYPSAGQYVSGTQLVITGTAQDNSNGSGVKRVQISTGTTWVTATGANSWAYTWTLPTADSLIYTISTRAEDLVDIVQSLAATRPITVDNAPPTGTVILTPSLPVCQWVNANTFNAQWGGFTDGGGIAGYQYLISSTASLILPLPGATFTTMDSVTETLPDGEWYFYVAAQDAAGNWSTTHYTGLFQVDTLSPTNVTITAPNHISATQFTVSWSADDAVSYTVEYSGTDYTSWQPWLTGVLSTEAEFPVPATETDYVFRVTAYDHAGNSAQAQTETHVGAFRIYLPLILRNYAPFVNGSFESGLSGWQKTESPLPVSVVSSIQERPSGSTSPADGDKAILLGNTSYQCTSVPIGHAAVEQTFTVPQDASNLTFKYIIWSQDASTSENYDRFEVYINNSLVFSDGNQVNTGLACDKWRRVPGPENLRDGATSGWATATIDLVPYRDQSITLSFRNYSRYDNYYNTYTYVDDVRVEQ